MLILALWKCPKFLAPFALFFARLEFDKKSVLDFDNISDTAQKHQQSPIWNFLFTKKFQIILCGVPQFVLLQRRYKKYFDRNHLKIVFHKNVQRCFTKSCSSLPLYYFPMFYKMQSECTRLIWWQSFFQDWRRMGYCLPQCGGSLSFFHRASYPVHPPEKLILLGRMHFCPIFRYLALYTKNMKGEVEEEWFWKMTCLKWLPFGPSPHGRRTP